VLASLTLDLTELGSIIELALDLRNLRVTLDCVGSENRLFGMIVRFCERESVLRDKQVL